MSTTVDFSVTVDIEVDCVLSCTWHAFTVVSDRENGTTPQGQSESVWSWWVQEEAASDELLEMLWHNVSHLLASVWISHAQVDTSPAYRDWWTSLGSVHKQVPVQPVDIGSKPTAQSHQPLFKNKKLKPIEQQLRLLTRN